MFSPVAPAFPAHSKTRKPRLKETTKGTLGTKNCWDISRFVSSWTSWIDFTSSSVDFRRFPISLKRLCLYILECRGERDYGKLWKSSPRRARRIVWGLRSFVFFVHFVVKKAQKVNRDQKSRKSIVEVAICTRKKFEARKASLNSFKFASLFILPYQII